MARDPVLERVLGKKLRFLIKSILDRATQGNIVVESLQLEKTLLTKELKSGDNHVKTLREAGILQLTLKKQSPTENLDFRQYLYLDEILRGAVYLRHVTGIKIPCLNKLYIFLFVFFWMEIQRSMIIE